jgi:hypothetical protein
MEKNLCKEICQNSNSGFVKLVTLDGFLLFSGMITNSYETFQSMYAQYGAEWYPNFMPIYLTSVSVSLYQRVHLLGYLCL